MSESRWVWVAAAAEIAPGEMRSAWADDLAVVVVNVDGQLYAMEDKCSHEDFELSAGAFDAAAGSLECVLHGARFDVRSGEPLCPPAYEPVRKLAVERRSDGIYVDIG